MKYNNTDIMQLKAYGTNDTFSMYAFMQILHM